MMSVMVPFSSDSISSTGPGMGSCWHKCSARRICCRFCQMISASFSHLGEGGSEAQHPPCGASAPPPPASPPPPGAPTRSATRPGYPRGDPRSPPAAAGASTGSARRPGWSFAACAAAAASSGASRPAPARRHGVTGRGDGGHSRHGDSPPALTTRYCCSVWASRCSQASSDAFFCCSVVSRDRRSWGPSWESWENWAGGRGAASGPAPSAPGSPPSPPRPQIHLGGACSPGTG